MIKLALLAAAFLVVGTMDYDDQQLAYDDYCDKVEQGIWQPFKGECAS